VLLNTTNTLGSSEVKSIAGIVAGDVTGLTQNKITIADQNGDVLWPTSTTTLGNSLTAKQSAENAYDTQEADKVDAALAATLGPGVALVNISADLNANQQSLASVTYGKKPVPSSTNLSNTSLTGAGTVPNGAAGTTATNQASGSYAQTGSGNSKYNNKTGQTNYLDDKTISHSTIAPGAINRQSIAVTINSKKVPASELPTIRSLVQNAVGFNAKRGDTMSIGSLPFAKIAAPAAAASSTGSMTGKIKYVLVGLGALGFLFFMSRLLRKRETEQFAGQPTWLRELETPRSLAELEAQSQMVDLEPPTMVARLRPPVNVAKQQVEELVDRDPERVAQQIRQWMTED
jgi:flagellar M-ring protein FliF